MALSVLEVIQKEQLNFKVMLGAYIEAEMNNFGCPWGGGVYDEDQLESESESIMLIKIEKLIAIGKSISLKLYFVVVCRQ
ncbi:MAG: hypothetical protein V9E96_16495 [Chitinophagaceae bacterium]